MIGGKEKKNMRDGELFKRGVPEKLNLINLKSANQWHIQNSEKHLRESILRKE